MLVSPVMRPEVHNFTRLLKGPPGCGKTTSVWALARDMLGEEKIRDAVLELNASDER